MPREAETAQQARRIIAIGETPFRPYDRFGSIEPNMSWLPLSPDAGGGAGCFLVRFDPGGRSQPHEHVDYEEFLVLEGALTDDDGKVLHQGDFVSYPPGSRHFSVSPEGCLIIVFLRRPNRRLGGE